MTTRKPPLIKNSLLATVFPLLLATPIVSQAMELVEMVGEYQIVKVVSSSVCFAAYNGKSARQKDVTFASYKTISGERWQVAGYVDQENISSKGDLLSISFDNVNLFSRSIEFSSGKFALPLFEDKDLKAYTQLVESKETLKLSLMNLDDSIVIDLSELGKARNAMDKCLAEIN
jgi:hypothetical protein